MTMKKLSALALTGLLAAGSAATDLVIPDLSYRTGPYAAGGTPFSDGYQDYFALLNARDGGIGGEEVRIIECETGFNAERGVECYESTKGEGALVYQPLSTAITYQLIPKATADNIPIHSMGYGRTSAENGEVFNWIFNYPVNYWDGASIAINYLLDENGGSLEGKDITLKTAILYTYGHRRDEDLVPDVQAMIEKEKNGQLQLVGRISIAKLNGEDASTIIGGREHHKLFAPLYARDKIERNRRKYWREGRSGGGGGRR